MPSPHPVLVAIDGPLKGTRVPLERPTAELGRDSSCLVRLPEAAASRRHCRIERRSDGAWMVRDLESLNGTLVNGAAVAERVLVHGDRLEVGDSTFVYLDEPVGPEDEGRGSGLPGQVALGGCSQKEPPGHHGCPDDPILERVRDQLAAIAPGDAPVLIEGESGTGKEVAARALHRASLRAGGPFVAIRCSAVPEGRLEREVFGQEDDALAGTGGRQEGKLELAGGGTLYLDEIGALAPSLQARVLRVIEERRFARVGGTRALPVDVRVLAATELDLSTEVDEGRFSRTLHERLAKVSLKLSPLRERPGDILLLADHLLAELAAPSRRQVRGLSPSARDLLLAYPWPGNVRELRNAMEHALVLGSSEVIEPEDLPQSLRKARPTRSVDSTITG